MASPHIKRLRPPPIKLSIPLLSTEKFVQISPVEDVLSPGCYIEPYVLTAKQHAIVTELQKLRKQIQCDNPRDKNEKARVLDDTNIYLSNAFVAESFYQTKEEIALVSCLTHREGYSRESRPDSIFTYNVKDSENIKILHKINDITVWIDKQIQSGKTVIIHCYAGINRSASVALAYHCLKTGHDIVTGFRYLAEQRSGILSNTKFIEQLVIWADIHGLLPKNL